MSKLEQIKPDTGQIKFLCEAGQCLAANNRFTLASEIFKGVIELIPNRALGYTLLGDAYLNLQKFDEALKTHQRALEAEPDNNFARVHLGETLLFKRQKDKGIAELRKVLEAEPNGPNGALARQLIKGAEQGIFTKLKL